MPTIEPNPYAAPAFDAGPGGRRATPRVLVIACALQWLGLSLFLLSVSPLLRPYLAGEARMILGIGVGLDLTLIGSVLALLNWRQPRPPRLDPLPGGRGRGILDGTLQADPPDDAAHVR